MKTQREQIVSHLSAPVVKTLGGAAIAKLGAKRVTQFAHPTMLVADAVQVASEYTCTQLGMQGHQAEKVSRGCGFVSSMGTGAYLGAAAGPAGMMAGAAGGAAVWLLGEAAGAVLGIGFAPRHSR
jgi:hypothetical protein